MFEAVYLPNPDLKLNMFQKSTLLNFRFKNNGDESVARFEYHP